MSLGADIVHVRRWFRAGDPVVTIGCTISSAFVVLAARPLQHIRRSKPAGLAVLSTLRPLLPRCTMLPTIADSRDFPARGEHPCSGCWFPRKPKEISDLTCTVKSAGVGIADVKERLDAIGLVPANRWANTHDEFAVSSR